MTERIKKSRGRPQRRWIDDIAELVSKYWSKLPEIDKKRKGYEDFLACNSSLTSFWREICISRINNNKHFIYDSIDETKKIGASAGFKKIVDKTQILTDHIK